MIMRVCLVAALAATAAAAPAAGQLADETQVPRMALAAFKRALDAGRVLPVDVSDAVSYAEGHIPGAVHVPLEALQKALPSLKASKKVIVAYCA